MATGFSLLPGVGRHCRRVFATCSKGEGGLVGGGDGLVLHVGLCKGDSLSLRWTGTLRALMCTPDFMHENRHERYCMVDESLWFLASPSVALAQWAEGTYFRRRHRR